MTKAFLPALLFILFLEPFLFRIADFEARENDSRLYTYFVKQLSERPIAELVALEWRKSSPFADPNNPYVRDHLIGQFIPSVILVKLGWDYRYAHYVVNQVYRLFIPYLMFLFALQFMKREEAVFVLLAGHINIMALNYGLRANQEQALLFWFLLSLYGFSKTETTKGKALLYLGSIMGFLVKGAVGLVHYPFWVLGVFVFSKNKKRDITQLILVGLILCVIAGIYELWFAQMTGFSFWKGYFEIQVFGRSKTEAIPFSSLVYYLPRAIGYAAPWSLALILFFKKEVRKNLMPFAGFPLILSAGMVFILGSFGRHASRYIFPVYYLLSMVGAGTIASLPKLRTLGKRLPPNIIHLAFYFGIFVIQFTIFLIKGKTFVK